jgi:hypothetical protein
VHSLQPGFLTVQLDERHKDNELRGCYLTFAIFAVAGLQQPIFVLSHAGESTRILRKVFNPGTSRRVN